MVELFVVLLWRLVIETKSDPPWTGVMVDRWIHWCSHPSQDVGNLHSN